MTIFFLYCIIIIDRYLKDIYIYDMCCYDTRFEFENDLVNVECVKANGDIAIKEFCKCKENGVEWYE